MSRVNISITGGIMSVGVDYSSLESDVDKVLSFDETNIEEVLKNHASDQAYWEAVAIKLKSKYETFETEWKKKWWAHSKKFAREYLHACGESKPTIDSVLDSTILIYSRDCTDHERDMYCKISHGHFMSRNKLSGIGVDEYYRDMYKFLLMDPPWYYETVEETSITLKENQEIIQSVAKKMDSRSFHIQNFIELIKKKMGNTELKSVTSESQMMSRTTDIRKEEK